MDKTYEREVGTSYAPCFPLLKLQKYPEGGEECLIHNASASPCFVLFFLFVARA